MIVTGRELMYFPHRGIVYLVPKNGSTTTRSLVDVFEFGNSLPYEVRIHTPTYQVDRRIRWQFDRVLTFGIVRNPLRRFLSHFFLDPMYFSKNIVYYSQDQIRQRMEMCLSELDEQLRLIMDGKYSELNVHYHPQSWWMPPLGQIDYVYKLEEYNKLVSHLFFDYNIDDIDNRLDSMTADEKNVGTWDHRQYPLDYYFTDELREKFLYVYREDVEMLSEYYEL